MVHFIFIDRSFDELTSPSLSADKQVVCTFNYIIIEIKFSFVAIYTELLFRVIHMWKRLQHVLENTLVCF